MTTLLFTTFALTFAAMFLLWLLSLKLKNASIVDIWWGLGFVLIAWASYALTESYQPRKLLVCTLVTIWGLRLAWHLWRRNRGKGEDFRYRAMRKRHGAQFKIISLFLVFGLQGLLLWVVSLPLQFAQAALWPWTLTWWDYAGSGVWFAGFLFEAVSDWQLARFKAEPQNKGRVLNQGLWRYTRHPNYFGDALVWWGFWLIAMATPDGFITILSPLLLTFLLLKVSGVALLERSLVKTRPGYQAYMKKTSAFIPWFPKNKA
jgi:steroid 5-alpha reductase family enzyme